MNKLTDAIHAVEGAFQKQFKKPIKRKLGMEACMRKAFLVINNGNVHRDDWCNGPHLPDIRVNPDKGIQVIMTDGDKRYFFIVTKYGEVTAMLGQVPTLGMLSSVEKDITEGFMDAKPLVW